MADLRPRPAPLFPIAGAQSSSQPFIEFGNRSVIFRQRIVVQPTCYIAAQFLVAILHADAPTAAGEFSHAVLEAVQRFIAPDNLGASKAEA